MSRRCLYWVMVLFWIIIFFFLLLGTKKIMSIVLAQERNDEPRLVYISEHPDAKEERENKIKESVNILVDEIIKKESFGNPKICNLHYGCRAGMGSMGFISSTWNSTLDRMKKEINGIGYLKFNLVMPDRCWEKVKLPVSKNKTEAIFDGECNRIAGTWLLMTDGIGHWEPYSGTYIPLIKKLGLLKTIKI